jgi:hypothetical protein
LQQSLETLEEVEKATLRMVAQAIFDFAEQAKEVFANEQDLAQDIAEDVTREALDSLGFSRIPVRLFGKIDYKRARYVFHPNYSLKQAPFVDSKAESVEGAATATIQTSQTSMTVRQRRSGRIADVAGKLPRTIDRAGETYLTTTVFVKYHYREKKRGGLSLINIVIACLPNGMLQERYNPNPDETIWRAGRDAPTRGEEFRVRIHFHSLQQKARWRVQEISQDPRPQFTWTE